MTNSQEHGATSQCLTSSHRCISLCCDVKAPVTIISPDSEIVSKGVFQRLENGTVTIRLTPGDCPLLSDLFCCATFQYKSRRWFFFTSILGVQEKADRELVLAMPQQIVAEKRRPAVRISVPKESDFDATLHYKKKTFHGEVVNINVHGVLVDFHQALDIKLETPSQIDLSLREHNIMVPACPVRREGSRLGFAFEGPSQVDWRAGLENMIRQIDRDWINRQARIDNIPQPYVDLSLKNPRVRAGNST